jgi:hypothetical protein
MIPSPIRKKMPAAKAAVLLIGIACWNCSSAASKDPTARCDSLIKSIAIGIGGKVPNDMTVRLTRFAWSRLWKNGRKPCGIPRHILLIPPS